MREISRHCRRISFVRECARFLGANLRVVLLISVLGLVVGTSAGAATRQVETSAESKAANVGSVKNSSLEPLVSGPAVYTPGELYGGANPTAVCFTCEASAITGSAPPSSSLDGGTGVDTLTGDFSTSLSLFSVPTLSTPLTLSLTYDAQLAQSEVQGGSAGQWGYGWSSSMDLSVTPQAPCCATPTSQMVVNQGSGSEVDFEMSANNGLSTTCPSGDYPTTNKYTSGSAGEPAGEVWGPTSDHQWCALDNVQAEFSDFEATEELLYFQDTSQDYDAFAWDGEFVGQSTPTSFGAHGYIDVLYDVSPGTTSYLKCPDSATDCTVYYSADERAFLEAFNSLGQVYEVIDPSGVSYTFTYSSSDDLESVTEYANQSSPSTWDYVYDTGAPTPYTSDMTEIYDPDAGVSTPAAYDLGAYHSTSITFDNTGTDSGMVSSLTDGPGTGGGGYATTNYSYDAGCSSGACVGPSGSQQTTITYPAQPTCPGCANVAPQEVVSYLAGLETATTLGSSTTGSANTESWTYSWTLGDGSANTIENITYPDTLSGSAATATIVLDPAGNVISTVDAKGDVATSAYNDVGNNVAPELLWSYPGSSSNAPDDPPAGAWVYTYNTEYKLSSATDPLGNATHYGYYASYPKLCYIAPPTVTISGSPPACHSWPWTGPNNLPSGGVSAYTYDTDGDVTASYVDDADSSPGADPQTTTFDFNVMGDPLWSIPPAGQSGVQSASNPYATVTTYSPANLPLTVSKPGEGTTTNTYDAALNLVGSAGPSATTTTVYDGDNRPCYQLVAGAGSGTGLTCSSSPQAGSIGTTYVPGSTNVASTTDSLGQTITYYYADLAYPNSPTEVVDPAGTEIQQTAYNDYGDVCVSGDVAITAQGTASQCNGVSGDTSTVFDALGNETSVTDPSGNTTTYAYTNTAYPTLETLSTNALDATTSYSYDADGNLLTTENPDGSTIKLAYDPDNRVCTSSDNGTAYSCGAGVGVSGVTSYTYNGASDRTSMVTYLPSTATTSYTYTNGQLTSTIDQNSKTVSYLYNYAGQVACVAYPVSTNASCGTLSSPATASPSNTIEQRTYDFAGRLSSISDWMTSNNTVHYTYGDANYPNAVTEVTYPASTGLVANYAYDADGNLTGLTAGASISDAWTFNADEQVATTEIDGSTSAPATYNANRQITSAANLASSTSNDSYTLTPNGEITADTPPSGPAIEFTYNAGDELCNVGGSSVSCGSTPTSGTSYQFTADGERSVATPYSGGTGGAATYYDWNAYGELCNVATSVTACGSTPTSGTSYAYNGDGLRLSAVTPAATTDYTWDTVSGSSIPLDINDATTSAGATTDTSYLYGPLLFGGTAPIEQITTTAAGSHASFLVTNPTGVQEVVGSTGTTQELALYSLYGQQTIVSGSSVTPFAFQGSYSDPTGLIYLINRYYDPSTDQFLSIDPDVATTDQPYVFTNDDPLNAEDPLGFKTTCKKDCAPTVTAAAPKNLGKVQTVILAGNFGGDLSLVGGSHIVVEVHDDGDGEGIGSFQPGPQSVSLQQIGGWSGASRGFIKAGDTAYYNLSNATASGAVIVPNGAKGLTALVLEYSLKVVVNTVSVADTIIVYSDTPVKVSFK